MSPRRAVRPRGLALEVQQVRFELVEALTPDLPVALDPLDGVVEWLGLEAAGPELGVDADG